MSDSPKLNCRIVLGERSSSINVEKFATSSQIISEICKIFNLNEKIYQKYALVLLPSPNFPGAKFLHDDVPFAISKTFKSYSLVEGKLSLYANPVLVHTSTRKGDQKGILLDYDCPLCDLSRIISQVYKFEKPQITYMMNYLSGGTWIHNQSSLKDSKFLINSEFLTVFESDLLSKNFLTDIKTNFKEEHYGWLSKTKLYSKMKDKKKKNFFLVSGFFLAICKSSTMSSLTEILSLDGMKAYYHENSKKKENYISLENVLYPDTYYLYADDDTDLKKWFDVLSKRCFNYGINKVFGVSLRQSLDTEHSLNIDNIPLILKETTKYLSQNLSQDGLFLINGYEPDVRELKKLYDLGKPVNFDLKSPNVVADLLKLWLNEQPETLLTTEHYSKFMSMCESVDFESDEVLDVLKLLKFLPIENACVIQFISSFFHQLVELKKYNSIYMKDICNIFSSCLVDRTQNTKMSQSKRLDQVSILAQLFILNEQYIHRMILEMIKEVDGSIKTGPELSESEVKEHEIIKKSNINDIENVETNVCVHTAPLEPPSKKIIH